jgi:hypothetical protein
VIRALFVLPFKDFVPIGSIRKMIWLIGGKKAMKSAAFASVSGVFERDPHAGVRQL